MGAKPDLRAKVHHAVLVRGLHVVARELGTTPHNVLNYIAGTARYTTVSLVEAKAAVLYPGDVWADPREGHDRRYRSGR